MPTTSVEPSNNPTPSPSNIPTANPTASPTLLPSMTPSKSPTFAPTPTPPPVTGVVTCNGQTHPSGGQQTQTYAVNLGGSKGRISIWYYMYSILDQLEVFYEGNLIFCTGGLVSGSQTHYRDIDGKATVLYVKITAPRSGGTAWQFRISCPNTR